MKLPVELLKGSILSTTSFLALLSRVKSQFSVVFFLSLFRIKLWMNWEYTHFPDRVYLVLLIPLSNTLVCFCSFLFSPLCLENQHAASHYCPMTSFQIWKRLLISICVLLQLHLCCGPRLQLITHSSCAFLPNPVNSTLLLSINIMVSIYTPRL